MNPEQFSRTALVIAKSTYVAGLEPRSSPLVPELASQVSGWFVADHAADYRLLQRSWYRRALRVSAKLVLPGMELHFAARKRVLELQVRSAIEAGATQVVVVAGGFDTLAYRMHGEFPTLRFIELDHPATQACKRQSLQRHGQCRANLVLSAVDLSTRPLNEALAEANVRSDAATVVLVEGLLMYLPLPAVDALVEQLAAYFSGALTLLKTFMVPDARGRRRFHNSSVWLDWWLALRQEPFLSASSHERLTQQLSDLGFSSEFWDDQRLREHLPDASKSLPIAMGEHICVARRASRVNA